MSSLKIRDFYESGRTTLKLNLLAGGTGLAREVTVSEINRPGLALTGYTDYFPSERVQIMGLGEHTYLQTLSATCRQETLNHVLSFKNLPCVLLTRGLKPHRELLRAANKYKLPVFLSTLDTARIIAETTAYLEAQLAPAATFHGVLVNVYGLGVLLQGDSGIGKSECALELIKRGHMIVSDDIVEVSKRSGGVLTGTGKSLIRHHMELRGIGIIDANMIFGIGAILDRTRVELVIHFEEWNENVDYDRSGLIDRTMNILGVDVPEIRMPVRPGRNLAVLVEIAALNQRLKGQGINTAQELNKRLIAEMNRKQAKTRGKKAK